MCWYSSFANARRYAIAETRMGKGIDVINVVSTFPPLTSSNRDRRRVNIAALALSWEWESPSEGRRWIRLELTSYSTTLADVLGTTKNNVSRVDSARLSIS